MPGGPVCLQFIFVTNKVGHSKEKRDEFCDYYRYTSSIFFSSMIIIIKYHQLVQQARLRL